MATVDDKYILKLEQLRNKLRNSLASKGITVSEDAPLDKLVELTEKEYYINEENKQDNLYKLLLGN